MQLPANLDSVGLFANVILRKWDENQKDGVGSRQKPKPPAICYVFENVRHAIF